MLCGISWEDLGISPSEEAYSAVLCNNDQQLAEIGEDGHEGHLPF